MMESILFALFFRFGDEQHGTNPRIIFILSTAQSLVMNRVNCQFVSVPLSFHSFKVFADFLALFVGLGILKFYFQI
jgi:hypothetical protein